MSCCVKANKSIHCKCSDCSHSGKYHRPFFKRILNFSTYSSLPLVLLWVVMIVLVYYIKTQSVENQVFYPYHILGLKPGAPDSEIKEGIYPDKNPDPEANKYFVEKIVKTYQALTDPVSRENYEKYGHPDGRQGFEMGIAPLQFLLDMKRNGGILFLGIVGVDILLPLVIASCCISLKVGKIYRQLCHAPGVVHLLLLYEASLAPSKAMGVFIKAAEDTEIPVCRTDNVPLQKLLMLVRSELNLDLKNIKQEQAQFWKQHPALVKVETKLRSKGR